MGSPVTTFVIGKYGGNLLLVLALALFAAIRPLFGWFAVAVIGFGIALAIVLRLLEQPPSELHAAERQTRLLTLLAVALFAAIWSMFGWFVLAAVGGRRDHGDRLAAMEHASSQ